MTVVTLSPHAEELLEAARARGLGSSPEEIIERALEEVAGPVGSPSDAELEGHRKAVEAMLEFRRKHHLTLGPGLRIKDLLREGRKYC
jgi:hypothetical protein